MARRYLQDAINPLLDASALPTAAQLAQLAALTASGAELNYLDTSAVGTVTAGKVMTVDANAQVSGWRRKVVSVDGGNINAAMAGAIVNNTPSGSAAVFNLPAALVGMEFYFYVLSAFALRINPCLLYTSPSPRDRTRSRMPSSA